MTITTRPSTSARPGATFTLLDVVDGTGHVIGTVRCADLKVQETDASGWLGFRGAPSLGRPDLSLGEFPSLKAAVGAVSAAA